MSDEKFDTFRKQALAKPDEFRQHLKTLKEILPQLEEYAALTSRYRKHKFDSLVGAGFTEKQALELCKEFP